MVSKGWKFCLASLVAVSLVACSDDDKHDRGNGGGSSYAGYWASELTVDLYKDYRNASRSRQLGPFCRDSFLRYYDANELELDALWVQRNGEVFYYRADDRMDNHNFRRDNWWGNVANDGRFTDRCRRQDQHRDYNRCNRAAIFDGSFYSHSKNRMIIYSSRTDGWNNGLGFDNRRQTVREDRYESQDEAWGSIWVRVGEAELRGIAEMEAACMVSERRKSKRRIRQRDTGPIFGPVDGRVDGRAELPGVRAIEPSDWQELERGN